MWKIWVGLWHKIWYPLVWQTRWRSIRMTTSRSSQATLTSPIDPRGFHYPPHCLRNYNPVCGMQERQEPVSLERAESPRSPVPSVGPLRHNLKSSFQIFSPLQTSHSFQNDIGTNFPPGKLRMGNTVVVVNRDPPRGEKRIRF